VKGYTEGFKDALSLLRFESEVEWHENRKFLKAEFPVDIYSDTVCSPWSSALLHALQTLDFWAIKIQLFYTETKR